MRDRKFPLSCRIRPESAAADAYLLFHPPTISHTASRAGFFGDPGLPAKQCPANSFCPAEATAFTVCPSNTASPAGSSAKVACRALAGFFGAAGEAAAACPRDSYCPAGAASAVACPPDTVSPAGSTSKADCVEKANYPAQCDPAAKPDLSTRFLLCMYRSETGLSSIPRMRNADQPTGRLYFVGKAGLPVVDLQDLRAFRSYVPAVPNSNYAWAILGALRVAVAGTYQLCTTSDDGYAFEAPH
jgi:hypothetical protein